MKKVYSKKFVQCFWSTKFSVKSMY